MTPTTIPIIITPEAAARVAELGMQAELEQMLEHTCQTVPGLRSIKVEEELPYDTDPDSSIGIWVARDDPHLEEDTTDREWGRWLVRTFPPDVCRYFVMISFCQNP